MIDLINVYLFNFFLNGGSLDCEYFLILLNYLPLSAFLNKNWEMNVKLIEEHVEVFWKLLDDEWAFVFQFFTLLLYCFFF